MGGLVPKSYMDLETKPPQHFKDFFARSPPATLIRGVSVGRGDLINFRTYLPNLFPGY